MSDSPTPISLDSEIEASTTIAELLQKDSEEITDHDLELMVNHLRERRAQWERAEGETKRSGKKGARTKRADGAGEKAVKALTLDELDLGDL